jgi:prophage regulatory protein
MGRFLRLAQVKEITGLSRSTIYRYMDKGMFPKHYDLGPRTVAWLEQDIQGWFGQRLLTRANSP